MTVRPTYAYSSEGKSRVRCLLGNVRIPFDHFFDQELTPLYNENNDYIISDIVIFVRSGILCYSLTLKLQFVLNCICSSDPLHLQFNHKAPTAYIGYKIDTLNYLLSSHTTRSDCRAKFPRHKILIVVAVTTTTTTN